MTLTFEILTGVGGEVCMMLGTIILWYLMAGKTTDPTMRTFMYLQIMLQIAFMGWIIYFSFDETIDQIWLWAWMTSVMFWTWLFMYGGLWMTGNLVTGEINNEF